MIRIGVNNKYEYKYNRVSLLISNIITFYLVTVSSNQRLKYNYFRTTHFILKMELPRGDLPTSPPPQTKKVYLIVVNCEIKIPDSRKNHPRLHNIWYLKSHEIDLFNVFYKLIINVITKLLIFN